ncbi:MAG TPA: leucyl aminopeptidase [Burkholderiaceae bacterium]|nr:leucyl aminopeptidase [Burkholderiaceae bacterium]
MDISVSGAAATGFKTGTLVVGAFADGTLTRAAEAVDQAAGGALSAALKRGDLEEKAGSTLLFPALAGVAADRVLLVSFGARTALGDRSYRDALGGAGRALAAGAAADAAVALVEVDVPNRSLAWRVQTAARLLADAAYKFDAPRAKPPAARGARKAVVLVSGAADGVDAAVRTGLAIAEGMALTKDLGNLGGDVCNPAYMADTAVALGKEFGFEVEILERADMEKLGMHSALSVGRASYSPCKFIVMKYSKGGASKPIVLVGKGMTFDTGGVSLKPGANLDEMKYDMCGGGTVLGVFRTAARLGLPINLIGLVMAVENMPGGNASRPGDVVRSMAGITIEILNTDAEGRLVLCDALTYAERFEPACVVDIATLTGACVIALGAHASGLFANDDALAAELLAAGQASGDRAWHMPLWDDYQGQLKSNFADMSNLGGPPAGSVTAALFLSHFTKKYKWAHLDIAGTSSVSGDAKGATGRPVPLLMEFLLSRSEGAAR